LAVVKNATLNTGVQIFFKFLLIQFRRGVAESYDSMFSVVRNHHTVFFSSSTILPYHQQCMWVPVSQHPSQHLLFSELLCVCLNSYPNGHKVVYYYGFDWHFPND